MPKGSEKTIEKSLHDKVKAKGGLCLKLPALHFSGLPDRLILLPGGIFQFVETKSTGDKPSRIQRHVHRKLNSLGFPVEIIDKEEQIEKLIKRIYVTGE